MVAYDNGELIGRSGRNNEVMRLIGCAKAMCDERPSPLARTSLGSRAERIDAGPFERAAVLSGRSHLRGLLLLRRNCAPCLHDHSHNIGFPMICWASDIRSSTSGQEMIDVSPIQEYDYALGRDPPSKG